MPSSTRRVIVGLVSALAGGALAAPAVATPLPPSANPLPGSSFLGANGRQVDVPPNVDWQSFEAAGRVLHNPDPNAADTAFTGGSKEDEPGQWGLTTEASGVKPAKSNILDMWSAFDVQQPEAFLYLAFARAEAGGSSFLTFELNHDSRLWNNGRANIPCRRTGDLLVSYEPRGNDVDVLMQRWVTLQADLATGCARTGRLDSVTGLTPNTDVQAAINRAAITNRLPGFYGATIAAERFGEAALNLSRILAGAPGDGCFAYGSVWMHSRSSPSESSNMQDYVAPRELAVRTCAASGTKFHDLNGNGRRDRGEPGLPKWVIWADYDDDGVRDGNEPFGITDAEGEYVINDIRPPDGDYMLRETLPTAAARRRAREARVVCSFPNAGTPGGTATAPGGTFRCAWGPIDTSTTTYARGRDFGNFQAAELVVRKELEPSSDPGRFHLFVNRRIVVPAAGDGASRALFVRPGLYSVSEVPVPGTNPLDFRSTVECKRSVRRTVLRSGTVYANVQLTAGERAVCTFRNIRPGSPAIAIDKTGPATAVAGDTLRYTLYVTNPGDIAFAEALVRVSDPTCDDPPALVSKASAAGADASPGTLNPGDTWTYRCSRQTTAPADCTPTVVPNTATVTGEAGGVSVSDRIKIETDLTCPPTPPAPPPSPVVPPGPAPPDAGDAGQAGIIFRRATRGCIRVNFEGTRIARVRVFVNGQLRRNLTMRTLQRRLTPSVTLAPGRYRVSVRVTFQRGTDSPPVTLTGVIRVCGVRTRPPFTG